MKTKSGLENESGEGVTLKSVHFEGKLEGLLLTMIVKQKYFNDSDETIEATYTFPAGWGANLLGFSVELNGKRMQAVALAKKQAEEKYEKAIESGDTPVMLEKSPIGLYTANLGNLKPGEEAIIEIEYAQLLRFEKGRLRINVPTVIGERYGDAATDGHIAMHQTAEVDMLAEYPFTATLDVMGQMSKGTIACPSHQAEIKQIEGGNRVQLLKGGLLDRDFIVTIEDLKGESYVSAAEDDGAYAVVASFCPKLIAKDPDPLRLKILVDCSGSMEGDSIDQAQAAMHELIMRLTEADMVSYSKFGSDVIHTSKRLEKCSPKYIKNKLAKAVHETAADMGGTELEEALMSTFMLGVEDVSKDAASMGCDLLLITDGDVWNIEETVKIAKKSHHRIFAIGVGSAPAESLLKELAEQTGGACELVTPTESIADSVLRMTQRIQSARTNSIDIKWAGEVLWQSTLPKQVYSEETVHVYARLRNKPTTAPTLVWMQDSLQNQESAPIIEWNSKKSLPRMMAGAELLSLADERAAEELALKYQLASKFTNLLLVHVREDEDKAEGLPKLQKIRQMNAAGWGGMGTVLKSVVLYSKALPEFSTPSVMRNSRKSASNLSAQVRALETAGMEDYDIPAFLRRQTDDVVDSQDSMDAVLSPDQMVEKFNELCLITTKFKEITFELMEIVSEDDIWTVLLEVAESQDNVDLYWACLLNWLPKDVLGVTSLSRHAQRMINFQLAGIDAAEIKRIEAKFAKALPAITMLNWGRPSTSLISE